MSGVYVLRRLLCDLATFHVTLFGCTYTLFTASQLSIRLPTKSTVASGFPKWPCGKLLGSYHI